MSRSELVERARRGDREAFEVLAASLVDGLYALARLILKDADRAEDATQEALIRCWRDLPTLREPASFDAWMRRLLMHAITDEFRTQRRYVATIRVLATEPAEPDAAAAIADRELLRRGFDRLSVDHRAVLVLRLYLGLSIEDTASALGIPVGTTKSRLHYATEAMRTALEADAAPTVREVGA